MPFGARIHKVLLPGVLCAKFNVGPTCVGGWVSKARSVRGSCTNRFLKIHENATITNWESNARIPSLLISS